MRTCLRTKFPANREINREFCRIWPSATIFWSNQRGIQQLPAEFPAQRNREFPNAYQGKFFKEQGIGALISGARSGVD